jgi:serine/threonine protein phosphatase PrpC
MMDALQFSTGTKGGLRIVCQRWMRPKANNLFQSNLAFGAATRAYRMLRENGDTFVIRQWDEHALAGIIDGLGHGEFAQRASNAARQYLETHFDQPFEALFQGVGRACRSTRGVVMSLARFDLANKKITVAGVGNIEVRLIGGPRQSTQVMRRGIIGLTSAPKPVSTEHPWTADSVLVMHSDGIHTRWKWEELNQTGQAAPEELARRLVRNYGRIDDDATALVAKNMGPLEFHRGPPGRN